MRPEFKKVETLLYRLISLSEIFRKNDDHWSHLKHKELNDIFNPDINKMLEVIYAPGRNLAGYMSEKLQAFNDARKYPTLKSYVDSFKNTWVDEIDELLHISEFAKKLNKEKFKNNNWEINKMIELFDEQIELLYEVKRIINALKKSSVYDFEKNNYSNFSSITFEKIIQTIITIGKEFERKPRTYTVLDEETLRDFILVGLQAIIDGSATSETENKHGKTDILIRFENENIFIGECKIWQGKSAYLKAIDQLLGYTTIRDNNISLIVFVKNKNFEKIKENIILFTKEHSKYIRDISFCDIRYDFEFYLNEERVKKVTLSVLLFHLVSLPTLKLYKLKSPKVKKSNKKSCGNCLYNFKKLKNSSLV